MNNDTPADAMKLKPCPFCGSEAEIERYGTPRQSTIYQCTSCGCQLETGEEWGHGADWNKRTTSLAAQDWRKHTALLQVKAFVDEMIEGQYNCSPHQYFMAAQGRAIDLKPVIDAAVATDPAPSLAAQDGLVDAAGKMWGTLTYIRAASDCDASRNAADEVMREVEPALSAIKGDKS